MEKIRKDIVHLVRNGIHEVQEIAYGLGILPHVFESQTLTPHVIMLIEQTRVLHKAKLNKIMFDLIECPDSAVQTTTQMRATKFLLESLHNQSEKATYYKSKLKEEKTKRQIDQTIRSARLATELDEVTSAKFLIKLSEVQKVIGD